MPFFRQFTHLLPRSQAWRLPFGSKLRQWFEGLAGLGSDVREYADGVYANIFPSTTTELPEWEKQFGLYGTGTDAERRSALDSAWKQRGGQDPAYLQRCIQAAGFTVWVHECWDPVAPFQQINCGDTLAQCGEVRAQCCNRGIRRFLRNPLAYTSQPQVGTVQCGNPANVARPAAPPFCGEPAAMCSAILMNDPGYFNNNTLNDAAPPPIASDPQYWAFFIYLGGQTFPSRATVPLARKDEFIRLLLKLRPTQHWLVTLVDYVQ
jgi:hypothetical protein